MKFYNCKNKSETVRANEVFIKGISDDGGLYMPETIPEFNKTELAGLKNMALNEIAFEISRRFLAEDIELNAIKHICDEAFNFPVPIKELTDKLNILELFHGPTFAFKDFGARFLARILSYFRRNESLELNVLVATSGDTGSAVADGFYKVPGIKVTILYPSGKVSPLQEKQLTTLGENITALEVDGVFDDCQSLVKQAFSDSELRKKVAITSANSINFGRLLPQSFYYFFSALNSERNISFVVPSGNLGNVTAGLLAQRMGIEVESFIVATNLNDSFPKYLSSGNFLPQKTIHTISNAMDVGNPNNFPRIMDLFKNDFNTIKNNIRSYKIDEESTLETIQSTYKNYSYLCCPHTAVGISAALSDLKNKSQNKYLVLATAHPAKFLEIVESAIMQKIKLPEKLEKISSKTKASIKISADYQSLKEILLN